MIRNMELNHLRFERHVVCLTQSPHIRLYETRSNKSPCWAKSLDGT